MSGSGRTGWRRSSVGSRRRAGRTWTCSPRRSRQAAAISWRAGDQHGRGPRGPGRREPCMTQIPDRAQGLAPTHPGAGGPRGRHACGGGGARGRAPRRGDRCRGRPARPGRHRDDRRLHVPRALPGPAGTAPSRPDPLGSAAHLVRRRPLRAAARPRVEPRGPWTASCSPATPPAGTGPAPLAAANIHPVPVDATIAGGRGPADAAVAYETELRDVLPADAAGGQSSMR